jgi:hypothetical protein
MMLYGGKKCGQPIVVQFNASEDVDQFPDSTSNRVRPYWHASDCCLSVSLSGMHIIVQEVLCVCRVCTFSWTFDTFSDLNRGID